MERKVASGVRENGQAIDQIRAEFADIRDDQQKAAQRDKAIIELLSKQNSALSDKVNTLSLDLEKLKSNLHKAEQKHVSDHPTQRCVHIVAKTTKGHESENLLLQQISEKQVNTPVDSCVNCAQINESSHPVTKHNSVTKHEAKQSHLHQVGLKQLSNNSNSVNDVINNKGLSGKLNPDTVNNKQNYGHPSTSQKITHRSVNGENRVTTPRPAPPEWRKCLPLIDTPYNLDLEKLKANLHKAEQKHVSDHPTQRCEHIVAKTTKGHESENLLLQQISEKQVNTPVDLCVNCAQINESLHPVTKHNNVTKHEAKQSHLHQVGLKQLSNNSKSVNNINNKGLSCKLNPDTVNNKQDYGHPSTSQKITHRSVNGENRVTTPRPAPPEWLKCLPYHRSG